MVWSLFDRFPSASIFKIFSGRLAKTRSNILPRTCVGKVTNCSKLLSMTHCKKGSQLRSDV